MLHFLLFCIIENHLNNTPKQEIQIIKKSLHTPNLKTIKPYKKKKMAEEIIQTVAAPPNAPKYYYPGFYYYTPEPYQTTQIPKHHHHVPPSLKHAQHAVHELVHPFGEGYQFPAPHCDIRETKSAYYIDVELPGLRDKKDVKLKWTGTRSLFVDASIYRQPLPEETVEVASSSTSPSSSAAAAAESNSSSETDKKKEDKKDKKKEKKEKSVHFLKRERKTGEFARAFNFPVDIEQDKTVAKLAYGILSITVPKKEKEQEDHKDVEIEHAGH